MSPRPVSIPVQTVGICNASARLYIQTAQDLLDSSLNPVQLVKNSTRAMQDLLFTIRSDWNLRTLLDYSGHMPCAKGRSNGGFHVAD